MLWLVWAFEGHAEVFGLVFGELGELHANFFQVEARDFFVELFGQTLVVWLVGVLVLPEVELGVGLFGE